MLRAAHARGLTRWSLAILDEAHRTAGTLGKPWAAVHDDTLIPAERRLYMTATPRVLAEAGAEPAVSMDDQSLFGPVVYRLPFAAAIEQGLLADYRVVVPVITNSEILQLVARVDARQLDAGDGAIDPVLLAVQVALLRAAAQYGITRVITYHARVAEAAAFARSIHTARSLLPAGQRPQRLTALHVDSRHGARERRTVLDALGSSDPGLVIVANAGVLAEGVDVPAVDAVVFLTARDSPEAAIQAVGRALRIGGRPQKIATVIIPVPLGPEHNPEAALESSAYAPVWRTVRALRAHDERLAARTDAARVAHGRAAYAPAPPRLDLPRWLEICGVPVPEGFADAIALRLVRESAPPWHEFYGRAAAYHERHGHLCPDVKSEPQLHAWLYRQRRLRRDGLLPQERVQQLDALGMAWSPHEEAWARGMAAARSYHAQHGHLRVPAAQTWGEAAFPLGAWLRAVRRSHQKGALARERFAQLDALGFAWSTLPKSEQDWQRNLQAARAYHAEHGDLDVPRRSQLGKWLSSQRAYRRRGTLSAERIAALNALGIRWDPVEEYFEQGLKIAQAYHAQHGNLDVVNTGTWGEPPYPLGAWLSRQRTARGQNKLSAARIAALDALGMSWEKNSETWDAHLAAVAAYHARHGVLPAHGATYGDAPLNIYRWLGRQRRKHRAGTLDPQRAARLTRTLGPGWADDPPARTSQRSERERAARPRANNATAR